MSNHKIFTFANFEQLQALINPSFLQQHLKQENDKIFVSQLWLKDFESLVFNEEGFLFSELETDFVLYVNEIQKQIILKELTSVIMDLYDLVSSTYLPEDYECQLEDLINKLNLSIIPF